jgi:glutamate racemase
LPRENIVYLADQAHVPYGDRSEADLVGLLANNVATLTSAGVEAIVMGCNTSCAIASKHGWPATRAAILDLIDAAASAVAGGGAQRVGVLATTATARSGAYARAIARIAPQVLVQEVAAPALVPLVEAGILSGAAARAAVAEACAPFEGRLDALVLACTHYPLLDAVFAEVLGDGVARIDPALEQAARAIDWVRERDGNAGAAESGWTEYRTTGALEAFRDALPPIVGRLGPGDSVISLEAIGPAR